MRQGHQGPVVKRSPPNTVARPHLRAWPSIPTTTGQASIWRAWEKKTLKLSKTARPAGRSVSNTIGAPARLAGLLEGNAKEGG